MKKTTKKLVLAKETVRELVAPVHVVGGIIGTVTDTGCSGEISASCAYTCSWNATFPVIEPQSRNC
jgi:hypothetical protein